MMLQVFTLAAIVAVSFADRHLDAAPADSKDATKPEKQSKPVTEGKACGYGFTDLPNGFFGTCEEGLVCECVGDCADPGISDSPSTCVKSKKQVCTREVKPVCGTDGKTYNNMCEANNAKVKAKDGACEVKECICTEQYEPVCGSDKKTYSNACQANCAKITKHTDGACKVEDKCMSCTKELKQVCGTDKKTYGNSCLAECKGLKFTDGACKTDDPCKKCDRKYEPVCSAVDKKTTFSNPCLAECKNIKYTKGECGAAVGGDVCTKELAPVCGTDGKTYNNACEAKKAGVRATKGECKEATCTCTEEGEPVCGTDGKTYKTKCEAACAGIRALRSGECKKTEVECACAETTVKEVGVCDTESGTSYPTKCKAGCAGVDAELMTAGRCKCLRCAQPKCTECDGKCVVPRKSVFERCPQTCPKAECVETSGKTCTLPKTSESGPEKIVSDGWTGAVDCNKCKCDDGNLLCSKMLCPTDPVAQTGGYCYLSDKTKVKPGWAGAGVGDNHCNKCRCSKGNGNGDGKGRGKDRRQRRKMFPEPAGPVLTCTKRACEAATNDESVAVWGAKKTWEECKSQVRCKEELSTCGDCGWSTEKVAEGVEVTDVKKCQATCERMSDVKVQAEEGKSRDSFGWGLKDGVKEAAVAEGDEGLVTEAAQIKAKCAVHTKDCRDDDIECACPSKVSAVLGDVSKTDGSATAVRASLERTASKLACCRNTGDKTTAEIKTDVMAKMEAYAVSKRALVAGLEEQLLDCDVGTDDEASVICDALQLAKDASAEEISSAVLLASTMLAQDSNTTVTDIIDALNAGATSNVAGAAVAVAAAVVAALL